MKTKIFRKIFSSFAVCSALALFAFALAPSGQGGVQAKANVRDPRLGRSANLKSSVTKADVEATLNQMAKDPPSTLPLFTYGVVSSRDGNFYTGQIVGANPFTQRGITTNVSVGTFVVPLIIVTNSVITFINPITGNITGAPGVTVFDPTVADACLAAPNNVPTTLFAQSPILRPAGFGFFGFLAGNGTQYVDEFQRGNFWQIINSNPINNHYHVLLHPVTFLAPIVINVPAPNGFAGTTPFIFPPIDGVAGSPICPPFATIDQAWFDNFLQTTVIPSLAGQGVNPSNLPIFLLHNVAFGFTPVSNYFNWGIGGYHNAFGAPMQTYVAGDFDTSDWFKETNFHDTGVFSHEVGEWMNDPSVLNPTPGWFNASGGCQHNLEVGDILGDAGFPFPSVVMPNGFTYHLQELNFFSWFYGAPSIGVFGFFSNNGTDLVDAGPPCF
jgi:hypothetical protein